MEHEIIIGKNLFPVYPEIRLGLLHFQAQVKTPDERFWAYMDGEGVFGSSMSDSTRAMVTEATTDVLAVIYCFENGIDLPKLLSEAQDEFCRFAGAENMESWII